MMSLRVAIAVAALGCALVTPSEARHNLMNYVIDLDTAPEHRYDHIVMDKSNNFNATVWAFFDKYFANDKAIMDAFDLIADERALTEDPEMLSEIRGLARVSGLPVNFVHGIQFLYEIQTLMVPIVNGSRVPISRFPPGLEGLERIPWRGPGCTGIIATCSDGTVNHARDLDFSPLPFMSKLIFTAVFQKGGVEVFRSQMVAGYTAVVTAMRMGKNGWTIERNTRYPDHTGGNEEMFKNIFDGRRANGWTLRKTLETQPDFEGAVAAIAAAPFISTEYSILSGVRKGTILAKDPDYVAHTQVLGQPNFDERSDYIIITNFDFWNHDIREYFDYTNDHMGHPRRIYAQKMLNSTAPGSLTPEFLFEVINSEGVIATDTIFQAIMNVEHSVWNVSAPDHNTLVSME